jgi:hypothetical protein
MAIFQFWEEFIHLVAISKTGLVAPVSNAWSERFSKYENNY